MNAQLVRSLKNYPVKYAKLLGFDLLTDIHNEWLKLMVLYPDDYTLLGHRGSYKTTCLSVAFALLIVLKPDKTIFFIRKTEDDVVEIVRQVDKILRTDLFKLIVREIYDIDFNVTMSTSFKINTNLHQRTRGQVQLQGMGLTGSLTGKHADYVFTDDIVNVRDRASKAERERTKAQYAELQNIKNRGGRIFNTGTPWHKQDCISECMPNVHKWTVYDTHLIPDDQLEELRKSMSASLFAANYELKHIADKDALFTNPNLLKTTDNASSLLYDGVSHIDAAYGGDDYTAYTAMKRQKDGRIIALGKLWQKHVDACVPDIAVVHAKYRIGTIYCETNGDKGYLADELDKNGFYTSTYSEHTNKFIKIASYLKRNWANIYWLPDTDREYMDQILDYTEYAEHDDAPDSAASLLREMLSQAYINTDDLLRGGII